jgi:hypothetical protein
MASGISKTLLVVGILVVVVGVVERQRSARKLAVPPEGSLQVVQGKAVAAREITRMTKKSRIPLGKHIELDLDPGAGPITLTLDSGVPGAVLTGMGGLDLEAAFDPTDANALYRLRVGSKELVSYASVADRKKAAAQRQLDDGGQMRLIGAVMALLGGVGWWLGARSRAS